MSKEASAAFARLRARFKAPCLKANDIFAGPLQAIAAECGFEHKLRRLITETPMLEFIGKAASVSMHGLGLASPKPLVQAMALNPTTAARPLSQLSRQVAGSMALDRCSLSSDVKVLSFGSRDILSDRNPRLFGMASPSEARSTARS